MKLKISNFKSLFIVLCIISFIQPNFIVKISILNNLSILCAVVCFFILILRTVRKNIEINMVFLVLLLWRFFIVLPTVLNCGDIEKWGYQSLVFIGLYFLIINFIDNKKNYKIVYGVILTYVLINIIVSIIMPNGIFPDYGIYFLGIRTRFTEFSIALTYISIYYYLNCTNKRIKDKNILFLTIFISLFNVFLKWIATGVVVLLVIILLYFLIKRLRKIYIIYPVGFVLILILTINLINGNLLKYFSWLFSFLNKDITLTGRTIIWNNAIDIIKNNLPLGYGYINDGNIIPFYGGLWQSHNTLLQLVAESGIFGTISFYILLYKSSNPNKKIYNKENYALQISTIFGLLIMMMTEIIYYYPIFIFIILLMNNSKKLMRENNND